MRGHLLSDFQLAAVLEVGRDVGRPEGVASLTLILRRTVGAGIANSPDR